MKKALIPIMSALLVATLFTGCRKNVATETTNTTAHTTHSTTTATAPTHTTTRPTETTRHTEPSHATQPTHMPSILPETSDATGESGRGRMMPPRY